MTISYILYVHRSRLQELTKHCILWSGNPKEKGETYASQESCEETCEEGREEKRQEEIVAGPRSIRETR
jgi:hypothetical protein